MHYQGAILFFILLPIHFLCFFSQQTNNFTCSSEPFHCGNITCITYPFWGGSRRRNCGHPGFELVCNGDVPMLNISSLSYRVQEINFSGNTLRIAREDLWNSICPDPEDLYNTTIDPNLFRYLPESNDQIVTLYFNCTNVHGRLPNQFQCEGDDVNTTNLFRTGDVSVGPGSGITCTNNITIPVNHTAAVSLKTPTALSIQVLQAALAAGFSIQWWEDEKQYRAPFCNPNAYPSCIVNGPLPSPAPGESPQGPAQSPPAHYPTPTPNLTSDRDGSYHHPRNGNSSPPIGIILGIVLGITIIIMVSIIIYYCNKRRCLPRSPKEKKSQDVENILLQHGSLAPKRHKYSEIKKITKSFNDKLGQGGYGSVYKGILPSGRLVAVKVLMDNDNNGEEFINEVVSISRTSHVNIVNLLGFCYDRKKRALVYEFMPNKSLDKFISSNVECQLNLEKLYKIALGVAKGLEYLHTGCNTRIVHFDIKPHNILLDEDFCPKISDFGLAKLCKTKQSILSVLGTRGTIGYIAPEIFSRNFGRASHKSDVYSYGMMVLEMVGARNIVETESIQSSENYFPDKIYGDVILDVTNKLNNFRGIEEEGDTARKIFLVGFWCIQTTPSDRPSMSKVVEMLEGTLQSIDIPPKPFLFSPKLTTQDFSPSMPACAETENSNKTEEFS